jgi:hypothetical protein
MYCIPTLYTQVWKIHWICLWQNRGRSHCRSVWTVNKCSRVGWYASLSESPSTSVQEQCFTSSLARTLLVRMHFSPILYIDIYLYNRSRKQRENGLCAGKHQYTHGAHFDKYYIVSVRHFIYIFFLTHLFVKYGTLGGRMWFECHDWTALKKICLQCTILV